MSSAKDRLNLIKIKIDRAIEHIGELHRELVKYYESKPYEIRTKRNPETRRLIYFLSRVDEVPNRIAAVTGDAVQNLRSALDHLAQQLWLVNNPGRSHSRRVSFPFAEDLNSFEKTSLERISGIRGDALKEFRRIEPFKGGKGNELYILSQLSNVDKHRVLITALTQFHSLDVGGDLQRNFVKLSSEIQIPKIELFLKPSDISPVKVGTELFIDLPDSEENPERQFRFQLALYEPGIIEGKPLLETMQRFSDLVSKTVQQFENCLN